MRMQLGVVVGVLAVVVAGATVSQVKARQVEPSRTEVEQPRSVESRLDRWIKPEDRYYSYGYVADASDKWEQVIEVVPYGRWLVLTDVSIGRSMAVALLYVKEKERRGLLDTTPYRDHRGPWVDQQDAFVAYHSTMGLVVPAGSRLIIKNGGVGNVDIGWHLTGYYVDVE